MPSPSEVVVSSSGIPAARHSAAIGLPAPEITGRVLVVDDNPANRELLVRRLRRQGHTAETAEHGLQALAILAAEPFDLVLLDVMMPELNGYETLERLKADPALRHVPVIMITAVDELESMVRCIEMGAEDYLPKPFNATLLWARIGSALAKKRLRDREQVYARTLERELEIGHNIQLGFLPERLPVMEGWELASCFRPARQSAGDFYDAFTLPNSRKVALLVGDVCGKGVGAAVFMAAFRSVLRAITVGAWAAEGTAPADDGARLARLVAFLNDYVALTHSRSNMFATLCFGVLDPVTGALDYVNAGHDAPAITDGALVRRLAPTGPAVGLMPGLPFLSGHAALSPGETLVLFTDGVSDARDEAGTAWGEERLLAHLQGADVAGARLAAIERAVVAHIGGAEPFDDVTMLAIRRDEAATDTEGA